MSVMQNFIIRLVGKMDLKPELFSNSDKIR